MKVLVLTVFLIAGGGFWALNNHREASSHQIQNKNAVKLACSKCQAACGCFNENEAHPL